MGTRSRPPRRCHGDHTSRDRIGRHHRRLRADPACRPRGRRGGRGSCRLARRGCRGHRGDGRRHDRSGCAGQPDHSGHRAVHRATPTKSASTSTRRWSRAIRITHAASPPDVASYTGSSTSQAIAPPGSPAQVSAALRRSVSIRPRMKHNSSRTEGARWVAADRSGIKSPSSHWMSGNSCCRV